LIGLALCGHIRSPERVMEGKAKFIFPVIVTAIIVFVVSCLVTFLNIGLPPDFVVIWLKAFFTAWPLAAVVALFAVPAARRLTQQLVALLEGRR
jgi:hypothetical protein